jgi:hypothetical protein
VTLTVEYLPDSAHGQVLRFAGDSADVATLRDTFDRLAAGHDLQSEILTGAVSVEFVPRVHGGLHAASEARFIYRGDAEQWSTRARFLDPLTTTMGWQYLTGDDASADVTVIVTTYPDRTF